MFFKFRWILELILVNIAVILIIANIPTNTIFESFPIEPTSFKSTNLKPIIERVGWNNILGSKSEFILNNKVVGPESLVVTEKFIYTGLADGRLIEVDKESSKFRVLATFEVSDASGCYPGMYWKIDKCGRPLGIRILPSGDLYVIDAAQGLFKVSPKSGNKVLIALGKDDKNMKPEWRGLYNDLVVDPTDSNVVYVSVSTRKWPLSNIVWSLLERENSGIILGINIKSGKVIKVAENLFMANGVDMSADKKYLLFSETTGPRISKVMLNQVRELFKSDSNPLPMVETFTSSLPGPPDNIRLHNGKIYVGVALSQAGGPSLLELTSELPMIRKAIARIIYLSSVMIGFIHDTLYQHEMMEEVHFLLKSGHIFYPLMPKTGSIAVLDGNSGRLIKILGSTDFAFISEATIDETNGDLYYGSFRNKYLGKVDARHLQLS